jgi:hypothetical protein
MTDEMIALSRRAVVCPKWRWMPGMLWVVSRVAPLEDYAGRIVEGARRAPSGPGLPDLRDPATLGCLLALVREAWGDSTLHVVCAGGSRELGVWHARWGTSSRRGATEAEALVAALESAP